MDGVSLRPEDIFERLRAGWRWWLGELGQVVPDRVREAFAFDDAIIIEVRDAEFVVLHRSVSREGAIARIPRDDFAARALRLAVPRSARRWLDDPVILQLPPEEALNRLLRLPRGARRKLDGILRHEVVRQSPIDAQNIYYDYRATSAPDNSATLEVGLRIVRRESVDSLLQLCHEAGIGVAAIEFAGDGTRATGGTFPADPLASRDLRLKPRLVPALIALVLLLAASLIGSVYLRGEAMAGELDARADQARARAIVVERLQSRLDAADRQAAFLAGQKRKPAAVAVLAAVSRLLPDDASLYQFEMNGNDVRLHGYSTSAASLIALFDSSPYFERAEFRSPLMQGPGSGLQVFDIAFKLRTSGP